ncbi:MAG: AmmeMemoRadiSam system protein B, partial [Planctomycetota bacterium]
KAFTEDFYFKLTYSHLQPVLDTLKWLKHETDVWVEITNLIIPRANDELAEVKQMAEWILEAVGPDVPVHFSAFHPDYRMTDVPNTPHETLIEARDVALQAGIRHVYVGNVNDAERQSTYCHGCGKLIIERNWYALGVYAMSGNACAHCGTEIPGHFAEQPGTWGRKRQPVDMRQFHIEGLSAAKRDEIPVSDERLVELRAADVSGISVVQNESQPQPAPRPSSGTAPVGLDASALQWLAQVNEANNQRSSQRTTQTSQETPVNQATSGVQEQPRQMREAPTRLPLTREQRDAICKASAELVRAATEERPATIPNLETLGVANAAVAGIFVSLKRDGRLRSCMGSFGAPMPLEATLRDVSRRTATADPRFPRISPVEIPHLDMEVWLLFSPELVHAQGEDRVGEITIGTHGLQIIRGNQRGLLLPGVATDNGWDAEQFLDQVCIKAGLTPTAWKDPSTTLFRFEGNCIKGNLVDADVEWFEHTRPLYEPAQIEELRSICHQNVQAIVRGATPMYYCGTVPDESINGMSMIVTVPGGQEINIARMSLREQMPLQSSAFSMCENLAATLRRRGFLNGNFELDIAIAFDPAMHGSLEEPSIDGINSNDRAVLMTERSKTVWVYDQQKSSEDLVAECADMCRVTDPVYASIYSLGFQSTRPRVSFSSVPQASRGQSNRPPAVAGRFYPGSESEMNAMLDTLLDGEPTPEKAAAVMVPHAGWQFSGKLAADVLKRVEIPKRIIAIGPKHTGNGTDWAVAPHHTWTLPGPDVSSDYELAMQLAEKIDGLEPDAAAHQGEHGIEVELPIIARLAPETKVVGIAIGGATIEKCQRFAEQLAGVIRELDEPPLLLISSDMNHYAGDAENRRLDAIALAELDRLDEDSLLKTCRSQHISMCGVLPAVIVLKTLKELGIKVTVEDIGYSTSADVTGDTSRVVGYAGRIFR